MQAYIVYFYGLDMHEVETEDVCHLTYPALIPSPFVS